MGRKKDPNDYRWFFGIPAFAEAHRFVYMDDLTNPRSQYKFINDAKKRLYDTAKANINAIQSNLNNQDSMTIQTALDFLKAVADSEQAKEIDIIKNYRQILQQHLPKNKSINNFLNQLNGNIFNNPTALTNFYIELTDYLNTIRKNVDDYKQRLQNLKKHSKIEMSDLAKDDYRFRTVGDTSALLNNLIGIATRGQEHQVDNYAGRVRQLTLNYILQSNLLSRLSSGEDIAAAFVAVSLDIQDKLQKEADKLQLKDLKDTLHNGIFDIVEKDYLTNQTHLSHLQDTIVNNRAELNDILDAAKSVLNISTLKEVDKIQERENIIQRRRDYLSSSNSLYKKVEQEIKNSKLFDELKLVKFNVNSRTGHGNIAELIKVIQDGDTVKIVGQTGADTLHLGSMEFDMLPINMREQLMPLLRNIEGILTSNEKQTRKDRKDDRTQQEKDMNNDIDKAVKLLETQIRDLQLPIDNLFVYHESLKLYKSAETDELSEFHGRDLSALHYLDKLYSADGLANLSLPERETLDFLLLNLAPGAVGSGAKPTVEKYLSLFAGILMFDDVTNIAQDAANYLKTTQTSGIIKQIHLYNLNGVYVPASMLLSFMYAGMKKIKNDLIQNNVARVHIETSKAADVISNYLEERPTPIKPQWQAVAEGVASGISIRINFLKSFTALVSNLGANVV